MAQETYKIPDAVKGDTFIGVTFNLVVNAAPVDLTGAAIKMQLKGSTNSATVALTLEIGSGITVVDAVNGIFEIDAQIIDITPLCYFYDIQITFPDATVKTYIKGRWEITPEVTT